MTAILKQAGDFLSAIAGTEISIPVAKRHLQLVGEKGVCDSQLVALHQSGLYTDLLEAAKAGHLEQVDRPVFCHILGFPLKCGDGEVSRLVVDTSEASMPEAWQREKYKVLEQRGLGTVEMRFEGGEMYVGGVNVVEYLLPEQQGNIIKGEKLHKLRLKDADRPDLPDALLDAILANQGHPAVAAWLVKYEDRYPFFWGTVYETLDGDRFVRYLRRVNEGWGWDDNWLGFDWNSGRPALVLARPLGA